MVTVESLDELAVVLEPALDGLTGLVMLSCDALLMEGFKEVADE